MFVADFADGGGATLNVSVLPSVTSMATCPGPIVVDAMARIRPLVIDAAVACARLALLVHAAVSGIWSAIAVQTAVTRIWPAIVVVPSAVAAIIIQARVNRDKAMVRLVARKGGQQRALGSEAVQRNICIRGQPRSRQIVARRAGGGYRRVPAARPAGATVARVAADVVQVRMRAAAEGIVGAVSAREAVEVVHGIADVTDGHGRKAAVGAQGGYRDIVQLRGMVVGVVVVAVVRGRLVVVRIKVGLYNVGTAGAMVEVDAVCAVRLLLLLGLAPLFPQLLKFCGNVSDNLHNFVIELTVRTTLGAMFLHGDMGVEVV